jgi:hypothetical protein
MVTNQLWMTMEPLVRQAKQPFKRGQRREPPDR